MVCNLNLILLQIFENSEDEKENEEEKVSSDESLINKHMEYTCEETTFGVSRVSNNPIFFTFSNEINFDNEMVYLDLIPYNGTQETEKGYFDITNDN
jgi:hypothetical protein